MICKNCGSTAIRKTSSGKYMCTVCLYIIRENIVYTEEFKHINFKNQKKLDKKAFLNKKENKHQSYEEHIKGKTKN